MSPTAVVLGLPFSHYWYSSVWEIFGPVLEVLDLRDDLWWQGGASTALKLLQEYQQLACKNRKQEDTFY